MSIAMTIRLDDQLAEDLATVARCDGEPVAEAVRKAITRWVERRRADPNFQTALAAEVERLDRLRPTDPSA